MRWRFESGLLEVTGIPTHPRFFLSLVGFVVILNGVQVLWLLRPPEWERAVPVSSLLPAVLVKRSCFPPVGAQECKSCHLEQFVDWSLFQHAHANRLVSPLLDEKAFKPTRSFKERLLTTEVSGQRSRFVVRQSFEDGPPSFHRAVAVSGVLS